ncbi:crotonase/enoyl-CoA hydratase family protein [Nocardioides sp. AN3]
MTDAILATPAEADPRVLIVTLNRPEARNAIDGEVARGLAVAVDRLDADPSLRAGVLVGAGRGFSAGMDLKAFLGGEMPFIEGRGFAGLTEQPPRKPLIAAVEGFAVAGGLEVALACDLIVAARDAKMGLPEVTRSLVAAGGGLLRLAQRIPYHVAVELALTGDHLPVPRLHEVGLINRMVEPGEALAVAIELASRIANNAPLAVEGSKHILERAADWGMRDGWSGQQETALAVSASADAREGAAAFAERRAPRWQGR